MTNADPPNARPSWLDDYLDDDAETQVLNAAPEGQTVVDDVIYHDYQEVLKKQQEQFGRVRIGAALFGVLAAAASAALLSSLASLGWLGLTTSTLPWLEWARDLSSGRRQTLSAIGASATLLLLFIAYFCGGYVAGRMARFSGTKQGVAVWVWSVAIAIVLGVIAVFSGLFVDILTNVDAFGRQLFVEEALTVAAIVAITLVLGLTLGGAVLGGAAGMRYHRAVDRAGL